MRETKGSIDIFDFTAMTPSRQHTAQTCSEYAGQYGVIWILGEFFQASTRQVYTTGEDATRGSRLLATLLELE